MNFTSNPALQDRFHQFDQKLPPKGVKHAFVRAKIHYYFVKWFDGKKIVVIAFYTTFPHCAHCVPEIYMIESHIFLTKIS